MVDIQFSNNAFTTLSSPLTSTATSFTVASGEGSRFPDLSGDKYCYVTLVSGGSDTEVEIVKVTARSGDLFTCERGQDGTTARAFILGDRVGLRMTNSGIQSLITENQAMKYARVNIENKNVTATAGDTSFQFLGDTEEVFEVPYNSYLVMEFNFGLSFTVVSGLLEVGDTYSYLARFNVITRNQSGVFSVAGTADLGGEHGLTMVADPSSPPSSGIIRATHIVRRSSVLVEGTLVAPNFLFSSLPPLPTGGTFFTTNYGGSGQNVKREHLVMRFIPANLALPRES